MPDPFAANAKEEDNKTKRFDRLGNPIIKQKEWIKMQQAAQASLAEAEKAKEVTEGQDPNAPKAEGAAQNGGTTASPEKKKDKEKKTKYKVTFIDKIDRDTELARFHYVLSYKKYNAMNTFDPFEAEDNDTQSHCCSTF
uniref:Uncharacterized protein n=1 Tax=Strombidium rassoulzadegani TaxID=1082188 RepID=A0A7S3CWN8_9SPIT|mmetsp:Transcript_9844/g.16562  ORF Transcript_9844/g.16562 Transcript_9844/m.16562 type:complete len:139 (+) Transcript_9844:308-724(+)